MQEKAIGFRSWLAALAALALLSAPFARGETPAGAGEQLAQFHRDWVAEGRPHRKSASAPEFGVDSFEYVNVHAYAFQANTSTDLILDDGNGYRYFGAPAVPYMAAPVRLPSGSLITGIYLSRCAANEGDLVVGLYDNGVGGSGSGGGALIAGPFHANAGCGIDGIFPSYLYEANSGHPLYLVIYFAGDAVDGTTKFNDVTIGYRRQVAPAPAAATFGDVPTTDFGFQYVQALSASGITGGCGNGNYCPDAPVTRRQMAIFLAKALGLSWH